MQEDNDANFAVDADFFSIKLP